MKKIVKFIMAFLSGAYIGMFWKKVVYNIGDVGSRNELRFESYYDTLNGFLRFKQHGKRLDEYLLSKGMRNIAIYGLGSVGERLYDELKDSDVKVVFGIENNPDARMDGLRIISPKDFKKETVDAIIVSIGFAYDSIVKSMKDVVDCPIISLQKLVYEVDLDDEGVY